MSFLFDLGYWGWLIFGLVLLGLELVAPVAFFLWLGISALVTCLILFLLPEISWQVQFLVFSVLSVSSIILSRRYLVGRQTQSDQPNLNRRAEQYVGRVFTLSEAIEQGEGKVKVDDSHWKVSGPSMKKGSEVRVTSVQGSIFLVEPVE